MRSSMSTGNFFQKMKKKPAVQRVLDSLDDYTEDGIRGLTGTHFPMWIKEELLELKKRNGKTAEDAAFEIAMKMIAASQHSEIK